MKLSNSGSLVWQKQYGGAGRDFAHSMEKGEGGTLVIAGEVESPVGGDIPFRFGEWRADMWCFQINSEGGIEKNIVLGGTGDDRILGVVRSPGSSLLAVGGTTSWDYYMTERQPASGFALWVADFSLESTLLKGQAFFDKNEDNQRHENEIGYQTIKVIIKKGEDTVTTVLPTNDGYWVALLDPGSYTVSAAPFSGQFKIRGLI